MTRPPRRRCALRCTIVLLGALLTPCTASAQSATVTDVLVLGTYHFANPGLDLANARIDDVLAPRRQQELADLVEQLARFKPTVVAVEALADALPGHALPGYARYREAKGSTSRNEIQQIGYRLAALLGLPRVIGIDAPGDFPFEAVQTYAIRHGQGDVLQRSIDQISQRTRDFEAQARTATVGALLRQINEATAVQQDHAWYMAALRFGAGAEQPGADLLGAWMKRNAAICARLVQRVQAGDRVLVLFGAGHNHLLQRCVQDMPGWRLVEPGLYLP